MLEERSLGDPHESLSTEPSQTEQIIEDMMNPRLIERLVIDEDRQFQSSDLDVRQLVLNGGIEEQEDQRIENSANQHYLQLRLSTAEEMSTHLKYDFKLQRIHASPARRVLRSSDLRLSRTSNIGLRRTNPGS